MKDKHLTGRVRGGKAWSVQLNSFGLCVPVGGKRRDPDSGLRERCLEEWRLCVGSH